MKNVEASITTTLDSTNTTTYKLDEQVDRILSVDDMFYLCSYAYDPVNDKRTGKILKCSRTFEIEGEINNNGCMDASFIDDCMFTVNSDCVDILDRDLKRLRSVKLESTGLSMSIRDHKIIVGCLDGTVWSGNALLNRYTGTINSTCINDVILHSTNEETQRNGKVVKISDKALWAVHMSTSTACIYTGGDNQHVYILDNNLRVIHEVYVGNIIISIFSDGFYVLIGTYNNKLYRLDTRTNKIVEEYALPGSVWRIRKQNGTIIMPCMYDGVVIMNDTVFDGKGGVVKHFITDGLIYDCCIYKDVLYYSSFYERKVFKYNG